MKREKYKRKLVKVDKELIQASGGILVYFNSSKIQHYITAKGGYDAFQGPLIALAYGLEWFMHSHVSLGFEIGAVTRPWAEKWVNERWINAPPEAHVTWKASTPVSLIFRLCLHFYFHSYT